MLRMKSDGSYGFVEGLRMLRDLRRVAKLNRRPVIRAEVARERYEPLVERLAGELGAEFGLVWRPAESQPGRRRRRVFETTRWVTDRPLSGFPDWQGRLDATVQRVVDVVDLVVPDVFEAAPPEMPPEVARRLAAEGTAEGGFGGSDGEVEEEELAGFFMTWRERDRVGGDVRLTFGDDQTVLWAIASVKPA
ncbi:MAG: hypothetical protein IT193_11620 [Propionibacteriaceae bacterium]|nr:hypothetical protein [Propionibacteriaceae bacterium]